MTFHLNICSVDDEKEKAIKVLSDKLYEDIEGRERKELEISVEIARLKKLIEELKIELKEKVRSWTFYYSL